MLFMSVYKKKVTKHYVSKYLVRKKRGFVFADLSLIYL